MVLYSEEIIFIPSLISDTNMSSFCPQVSANFTVEVCTHCPFLHYISYNRFKVFNKQTQISFFSQ